MKDLGFSPADILIPAEGIDLEKWAVVACDQFTSDRGYWKKAEEFIGKYDLVCTERVGFEADSAVFKGEGNLLQTSAGTVESIELFRSAVQFQGELCGSSADEDRAIAFFQKNLHFFRGKFGFFDFCVGQMEQKDSP